MITHTGCTYYCVSLLTVRLNLRMRDEIQMKGKRWFYPYLTLPIFSKMPHSSSSPDLCARKTPNSFDFHLPSFPLCFPSVFSNSPLQKLNLDCSLPVWFLFQTLHVTRKSRCGIEEVLTYSSTLPLFNPDLVKDMIAI